MAQLPEELIIEILPWLPVKSIMRFRCLSKSICSVIDSLDFTNRHLCKSSQNFNLRKLIFSDVSKENFQVCDANLDLEEEILYLGKPVSSMWRKICGNCKGLVLLSRLSNRISFSLWNPSTRQYRDLPDCPSIKAANSFCHRIIGSGLGYDHSADDFKVLVRIYVHVPIRVEVQVWIYGLKSNIWRRAPNFPSLGATPFESEFPGMGHYYADGSLHWIRTLCRNGNQAVDLIREIVAFDVGKETFSLLPQPSICSVKASSKLHVLEDCLCISYFHFNCCTPCRADMYIRKRDGVDQFSWTKLFSIASMETCGLSDLNVLGYSKRGNKILLDVGKDHMASYDLKKKRFTKVEMDKDPTWETPILCLESLVSVGGGSLAKEAKAYAALHCVNLEGRNKPGPQDGDGVSFLVS